MHRAATARGRRGGSPSGRAWPRATGRARRRRALRRHRVPARRGGSSSRAGRRGTGARARAPTRRPSCGIGGPSAELPVRFTFARAQETGGSVVQAVDDLFEGFASVVATVVDGPGAVLLLA